MHPNQQTAPVAMLSLEDSLTDSPQFRNRVRQFEEYALSLESSIQALSKASRSLQQVSQDYSSKWTDMINRVSHISKLSPLKDTKIEQQLASLSETLMDIDRGRQLHSEQLQQILVQPMEEEIQDKGLITKVKGGRKRLDGLQTEYESQLNRLMSRKPNESSIDQMEASVEQSKAMYLSQMQALSLDLNSLASVKRADFLESFLSLMYAQYAYYHQAFASLRDAEPVMRSLGAHIAEARKHALEDMAESRELLITPVIKSKTRMPGSGSFEDTRYVQVGQQEEEEYEDDTGGDEHRSDVNNNATSNQQKPAVQLSTTIKPPSVASADKSTLRQTHRRSVASVSIDSRGHMQISGYLFLRSQYSLMASWQRRWFEIHEGQLVHYQRYDVNDRDRESIPLHLCMVKQGNCQSAPERRNVFELIAPNRTYLLQAESAEEMEAWKSCLRQHIESSLYAHAPHAQGISALGGMAAVALARSNSQPPNSAGMSPIGDGRSGSFTSLGGGRASSGFTSPLSKQGTGSGAFGDQQAQSTRMALMRRPKGNDRCVDCGRQAPEWAAINLGILMCIECSGIHRSLGVHVSKVRSVKLDNWEPELIQIMMRLGNQNINRIYEARVPAPDEPMKPTSQSPREDRQPYIMQKYSNRLFVAQPTKGIKHAEEELVQAAGNGNMVAVLRALAQGANPDCHDTTTGTTPLHEAVRAADFGILELLFLWGANANVRAKMTPTAYHQSESSDNNISTAQAGASGGTALHWASRLGNAQVVWYLVRKGAQWDTPDAYGLLPLDIALEDGNVSVVMALRYAAFQKTSGLPPGSMGSSRPRGSALPFGTNSNNGNAMIEPVDMLDTEDSFIRDWAVPAYDPDMFDENKVDPNMESSARSSMEFTEFAGSQSISASDAKNTSAEFDEPADNSVV
ncbi:hypothetical protein GGI07_003890 [Coemansia sp. Benny D115]|nr:hypothetical protein GGI07_003890 [Coemansia sp. Benny D115]